MLNKEILDRIKQRDEKMYRLIIGTNVEELIPETNSDLYFSRLCREIIGQQLSGKVVSVIVKRFHELLQTNEPAPEILLSIPQEKLREVGMAWSKVRAIVDLSTKIKANELSFSDYPKMNDEEILNDLLKVKGIGPWTAEMFLMFTLGREDVFSLKDLGLKKAVSQIYKLDLSNKNIYYKIEKLSGVWKPYRTYASLALWRSLDLDGWWR